MVTGLLLRHLIQFAVRASIRVYAGGEPLFAPRFIIRHSRRGALLRYARQILHLALDVINPSTAANDPLAPARTKLQLVKATAQHLRSVQRHPHRIRSHFEHEPVRYAA